MILNDPIYRNHYDQEVVVAEEILYVGYVNSPLESLKIFVPEPEGVIEVAEDPLDIPQQEELADEVGQPEEVIILNIPPPCGQCHCQFGPRIPEPNEDLEEENIHLIIFFCEDHILQIIN